MSTLQIRAPYSQQEIDTLYPENVELKLVQVLLRHGERAPLLPHFQDAGLSPHWPYCHAAEKMRSIAYTPGDASEWSTLEWRRRLEGFGKDDDRSSNVTEPNGGTESICQPGELTDRGRETTYALGKRLRHLYVEQLQFMPKLITYGHTFYLRATPFPRTLESVQQTFLGMYPSKRRSASFTAPAIVTRSLADEILFPNQGSCPRLKELAQAFTQRTAQKWDNTPKMQYITNQISKWMPEHSREVTVSGDPSLISIKDTINTTLAHGPQTRLPEAFYDPKMLASIDQIVCEEWFDGYNDREFRILGIGAQVGDTVDRMTSCIEDSQPIVAGSDHSGSPIGTAAWPNTKFAMYGCHDITLAAFLASLGAFENEHWPPYTSHLAIELFQEKSMAQIAESNISQRTSNSLIRRPWSEYSESERRKLDGYYVRLRYNDRVMRVPGCAASENHLAQDNSFCTLEAFKRIADGFTPRNWKQQCRQNLGDPIASIEGGEKKSAGLIEKGY